MNKENKDMIWTHWSEGVSKTDKNEAVTIQSAVIYVCKKQLNMQKIREQTKEEVELNEGAN